MAFPWHKADFDALLRRKQRLPHALLLRGIQGIGKLSFAESLARALLCEQTGPIGAACGRCPSCGWMEQGSHPDFRRLEPDSLTVEDDPEAGGEKKASRQIQVEQIRGISDFINISSHRGGAKVVLVHPAETLNPHAANALLKGLEEPPPQTYFLLVTHRWHHLLPTIISRCQHVALPPPTTGQAHDWLQQQGLSNAVLALAQAGGAPLLAVQYDEEYWQLRERFFKAIAEVGFDALTVAARLRDHTPALVVGWLQKWSFDLASHRITGTVRYNADFAEAIAEIADRIDWLESLGFHRRMVRLQRIVSHPLNARLFFEQLLLTYAALLRRRPIGLAA